MAGQHQEDELDPKIETPVICERRGVVPHQCQERTGGKFLRALQLYL